MGQLPISSSCIEIHWTCNACISYYFLWLSQFQECPNHIILININDRTTLTRLYFNKTFYIFKGILKKWMRQTTDYLNIFSSWWNRSVKVYITFLNSIISQSFFLKNVFSSKFFKWCILSGRMMRDGKIIVLKIFFMYLYILSSYLNTGTFLSDILKKEQCQSLLEEPTNAPPPSRGFLTNSPLPRPTRWQISDKCPGGIGTLIGQEPTTWPANN